MSILFQYIKGYEKESVLAPLFKLLEVIFDLMVPVVVAKIIDVGIVNQDTGYILRMFFVLIGMALLGLLSSFTAQYFAAKASVGFASKLRQALFDHIQSFSFQELDTLKTDTLITRLTDDVNQVQNGYNMALRLLLRSPFVVIGSMIMAFTINVECAIVFAISIPILFFVVFTIMKISIPLFKKVQTALDRITGLTRENLTGVRVVRAFCQEENAIKQFDEENEALTKMNLFVGRISALLNPLTYVLINIATVILIQKASLQVNLGTMQQGEVVALYNYMAQMIVELIKLASLIITLNKAMACADRVSSVLKVQPSMKYERIDEDGQSLNKVDFENVTFSYANSSNASLENISFSVKPGQTVGIIGPTGSGKSTLTRLLSRFYDADSGIILVDGQDVKNYSKEELMNKIGYVFQKSILFEGSIRDNLLIGNNNANDEELWKALDIAQAKEVVENKLGQLDFVLEQGGRNLSGGQKQRLTIARALVKKPEILILDDSASALDFATDAKLRKAIRSLKGHTTTFLVSQRTASIKQADIILVLEDGKLVGKGNHNELMKSCDVYQEIYYSQFPKEA